PWRQHRSEGAKAPSLLFAFGCGPVLEQVLWQKIRLRYSFSAPWTEPHDSGGLISWLRRRFGPSSGLGQAPISQDHIRSFLAHHVDRGHDEEPRNVGDRRRVDHP